MGTLYKLEFASGRSYIGITERALRTRLKGHEAASAAGSKLAVHNAWRKYGKPFVVELASVAGEEELLTLEVMAIAFFGTLLPGGYNTTPGGDFNPSKLSEVKEKQGAVFRGKKMHPNSAKALQAANVGRQFSPEHRAKLSAAARGRPKSEEHKKRIGLAHLGKKANPEAVEKMRLALTGRKNPEHSKRMIGNTNWKFRKDKQ